MDLHFSTDGNTIFTCSTDNTVAMWDLIAGQRIKKLKGFVYFRIIYRECVIKFSILLLFL